jgi:hypothetical protein
MKALEASHSLPAHYGLRNQPKAPVASDSYHVIITTNIHGNRMPRLIDGNIHWGGGEVPQLLFAALP